MTSWTVRRNVSNFLKISCSVSCLLIRIKWFSVILNLLCQASHFFCFPISMWLNNTGFYFGNDVLIISHLNDMSRSNSQRYWGMIIGYFRAPHTSVHDRWLAPLRRDQRRSPCNTRIPIQCNSTVAPYLYKLKHSIVTCTCS